MLESRDYGKLLNEVIERILERFGIYESTLEEMQSYKQKGKNIFISFRDQENQPWIIAFFWADANWLLEEKAYREKVYDIAKTIIFDFIQQGAALAARREGGSNERNHLAMEA